METPVYTSIDYSTESLATDIGRKETIGHWLPLEIYRQIDFMKGKLLTPPIRCNYSTIFLISKVDINLFIDRNLSSRVPT